MLASSFAKTNYDYNAEKWNKESALLRFEFFEVLVRIARLKYIENVDGKDALNDNESYRALHRLVNEHILPIL